MLGWKLTLHSDASMRRHALSAEECTISDAKVFRRIFFPAGGHVLLCTQRHVCTQQS